VVGREADILKRSRPAAARVSQPSVFEVAGDDSFAGEGGAEVANMVQVICGLPETAMDYEQEREGSLAIREAQLSKVLRIWAVLNTPMEGRRRPLQDVAQTLPK
jgi:hypothetical protein